MSESGTPEATRCPTCGSPDRRVCIPKRATAHRHPHDKWWPPNLEASPGCCADAFHSESGTPEAILSAEDVAAVCIDGHAYGLPNVSDLRLSHEALRAEVERLRTMNETLARNLATAADRNIEQAERLTAEREAAKRELSEVLDGLEATRSDWETPLAHAAAHALWRRSEARVAALTEALRKHEHTDECLRYAAKTGKSYCIAPCADSRRAVLGGTDTP